MKSISHLKNEELLLCSLCRLSFSAENNYRIRSLAEKTTDWKYFYELACRHGIAALVYNNLSTLQLLQYLPDNLKEGLRISFIKNIARNSGLLEKTARALEILNKENIKSVILKGLALELSVYGNSGLRQMTDVDILVSGENSMKARNILMENGFISYPLKSVFYKPIIKNIGKHLPTLTKEGLSIDLHNELFGGKKAFLTKMFFDNNREVDINGNKAFIPGSKIFFIYLVKHIWLHEMNNESQLRLFADMAVMVEKYNEEIIDPDLLNLAAKAEIEKPLATYLRPLRDLWDIRFPGWLNDYIDKWSDRGSIEKFIFFLKNPDNNLPVDKAKLYRYHLGIIPGLHRKFLFVAGDLFPTLEFMKKRYGCKNKLKAIFYYPLRLGKLLYLIK